MSLRRRLIAWYVGVGAFIALMIGLIALLVVVQDAKFQGHRSMAAAARVIPSAVSEYRKSRGTLRGIDGYLRERFRPLGVVVHAQLAGAPRIWPGPPRKPPPARESTFERLLAMQVRPIDVPFRGGDAIVFLDAHSMEDSIKRLAWFEILLAAVVVSAAWRIAIVVAQNTLEPLVHTTAALNRFGSGEFTRVHVRDGDRSELAELARAYNRAVGQITQALDERAKAEAEMRQFVADAGHQLRTPLTVIMGYVSSMAARAVTIAESQRYEAMLDQTRRMKDLIDRLITLARLEKPFDETHDVIDLYGLALRARSMFHESAQERIVVHPVAAPPYAEADEPDVTEALSALIDNALKYAPNGLVEIDIAREGDRWALNVHDRGPGMTHEDLSNAFDRFYRGSASEYAPGTGLGLAIARKSIERAGGSISIVNRRGGGLTVSLLTRYIQKSTIALSA